MFRVSSALLSVSSSASVATRLGARCTLRRGYKKTVEQLVAEHPGALQNTSVLVRVDFNVPQSKTDGHITDDTRIREAVKTIRYLKDQGAKVLLASHCGRPNGQVNAKMRLAPMAKRLSELLGSTVQVATDCVGTEVDAQVAGLKAGDILMLENVRFYKEEEDNDKEFARKLAKNATVFVNDAFGTAHRAHASTEGVCQFMKHNVAGYLMEKELKFLKSAIDTPKRPFAVIIGGSKISTKIPVIENLLEKADKIIVGGGMIFTFYAAMGLKVGKSVVEPNFVAKAKEIMDKAKAKGIQFYLPTDVVVADEFKNTANTKTVPVSEIPDDWMGLDIGQETINSISSLLADCQTVVWNGPMGVFEMDKFAKGTHSVAQALADLTQNKGAVTVVGGGDSVAAINAAKLETKISHVSTGGGASLEMLSGLDLPAVASLDDATAK